MFSVLWNGEVLDYHYKMIKNMDFFYTFYIGEIFIGQLCRHGKGNWSCSSVNPQGKNWRHIFPAMGFKSRMAAAQYLLKFQGYIA